MESKKLTRSSSIIDLDAISRIPRVHYKELYVGELVGCGGNSNVNELIRLRLDDASTCCLSTTRQKLAERCRRNQNRRPFVVKQLRKELNERSAKLKAAMQDLIAEGYIMASLNHPNILSVRALPQDVSKDTPESYFLVLDKLHGTLDGHIEKWRNAHDRIQRFAPLIINAAKVQQRMLVTRLQAACEVANAIDHLHERDIIYRDLKPTNVGIDADGTVKLFDFGLARQLPTMSPTSRKQSVAPLEEDPRFDDMTGYSGTLRYMSPEVYHSKPYNLKADVYSLSLVVWQVLAMKRPFAEHGRAELKRFVFGEGERPSLQDESCPLEIRHLLQKGWDEDPSNRPTAKEFHAVLTRQLSELKRQQLIREGVKSTKNRTAKKSHMYAKVEPVV